MTKTLSSLEPIRLEGSKKAYKQTLKKLQNHLLCLQQTLLGEKIGLILVFEGMDAAGKGGAIKRFTQRLDPRGYAVHPISAPQPHELRYHYLQRFWRKIPQYGQIGIFDRSWYGRVLVERVEQLATKDEWTRAYKEIKQFEQTLAAENYILIKHWIHVSEEEQLKRFTKRKNDPYKSWKLTDEDWRNREKYDQYLEVAEDMFSKTNCPDAPWFVVHGDDKLHTRLTVLQNIIHETENQLDKRGIEYTAIPAVLREKKAALSEIPEDNNYL